MLVLILSIGFGILNEFIQMAIPGRYAGTTDLGLNTIGALTGVLIYSWLERGKVGFFRRIVCG
jgi:VanZ family protein